MLAVGLAVGLCFTASGFAKDEVMIKGKSKSMGDTTKEKMEMKTSAGKEKVKMEKTGEETKAKIVTKTPKAGHVKKEVVHYHSYHAGNNTITVIKDKKEVKMPIKGWKDPGIIKKKQKVTITSTYDPKLLKYVVTDVAPVK